MHRQTYYVGYKYKSFCQINNNYAKMQGFGRHRRWPKKTNKAALLHKLEKKLDPVESLQSDYVNVIDGMAFIKKLIVKSNATFEETSEKLLDEILKTRKNASQIHIVFDVYKTDSIKNAERIRRSSGKL